jgi:tetratricopeptide (TPR) repeat protein
MLRGLLLSIAILAISVPALAAGDADVCRDPGAEPAARQAACEGVIADDTISGKPKAVAFGVRGEALSKKRDYDGAIAAYSAAHDAAPDNVGYLNARGLAYSNKGDDEHALADYDLCSQQRPNFVPPYNNRGLIYLRKGDLQRAQDEFNSAVGLAGTSPYRYLQLINRARTETLLKQYDAALTDYAEANKVNPDASVSGTRCITYTEMGKFDEALADCNEALAKAPKAPYALATRGNLYLAKGDLDAAMNDYNEAIRINPNYVRAHAGRGQLYEKRGDFSAARSDYRAASVVLTKVDHTDTGIARRLAGERLAVLMAALQAQPGPETGKPAPGKAAAPAPPPGPRKVALIVGNGAYKNARPLDNPPRDAQLIAETFRGLGFATATLAPI